MAILYKGDAVSKQTTVRPGLEGVNKLMGHEYHQFVLEPNETDSDEDLVTIQYVNKLGGIDTEWKVKGRAILSDPELQKYGISWDS